MPEWIGDALESARRGEALAMVTIVGAQGSTPREMGARMLVWPDRFTGTIGGGSLERQGLDQARKLLSQGTRRHALQDYPLGPLLGQCCGGHVRLLVERVDADSLDWLEPAARAREPFALTARFEDGGMTRAIEPEAQTSDSLRLPIPEVRRMSETIRPALPRLVIFGAGHVGQAVARAFAPLPFHLDWLASRDDLRPEASGTRAAILSEDELVEAVEAAPADTLFAIFTHSHDLDYRLTQAVLARGDFRYLGLIGSRTKRRRFEGRLRDDGLTDADLARLTCPIGIAELKSKAPAVIAISLAAELLKLTEDATA
ncbi:MAG: xanthine dehydrogenase accessory protein XdhC [Alphaproteobacteria bacterium]|nr:xanthine dehydrogenase accessory protein XdhC [Alphaproteobacteria bacterium]MBU1515251.1 xanthine dehydrogenase accessory protein XdhC [Alphaproteobacteria bacterium]MBU2092381.1 xanthine dehydrogenase accessory protein XdhC [Alphaproteobacteria bacterium]MBU2152975.1 xanthine dehydrogenase accessory protein XdhC [Alphaproteobacteria bacterium]MBU2305806.1 xanthine dehydrogenase accessory protein XdhC [Alphaproteobacteria bacterium]